MDQEGIQKIRDFVDHLLGLPNISNEPLVIGEGLILNFIVQNMEQLKATFKTPQFFPHLQWNAVLQVLLSDLYERVVLEIKPELDKFIKDGDFEILNSINETNFPKDYHVERFQTFLDEILKNKDSRYNMSSTVNIFKHGIIERYLTQAFKRRDVLYNELVRVQKTYLECDEYIMFLKTMLLIKNGAYLKHPLGNDTSRTYSITDALSMPGKMEKFIESATSEIYQKLPNLSARMIELALKSNLKESHTQLEDTSSRLLFILCSRFHNYRPVTRVDRGAESPDKSWFAIARKNADHYGYDKRLLDALYRIAGDNNW